MRSVAAALATVLVAGLGCLPAAAAEGTVTASVRAGHWAGGDIDFRVEDNRIKRLTVTSVHTCQYVGTGDYANELQTFGPPGRFRITSGGRVEGQRLEPTVAGTDYYDARFAMVGRFVDGKFTVVVQTSYKYWDYVTYDSPTNVNCYSEKKYTATRKRT